MLPSLGFQEIILLGIIALVVVGPRDLPLLLRKLGKWTAKLRGMAQEFRTGFDELARQAELDELRREVDALRRTTNLNTLGQDLQKPLGTLESYAGAAPPPAPVVDEFLDAEPASAGPAAGAADINPGDQGPSAEGGSAAKVGQGQAQAHDETPERTPAPVMRGAGP